MEILSHGCSKQMNEKEMYSQEKWPLWLFSRGTFCLLLCLDSLLALDYASIWKNDATCKSEGRKLKVTVET